MIRSLPWILVPGFGFIQRNRPLRGLFYFAVFAATLNGFLVGPLLFLEPWLRWSFLGAAAAAWIGHAVDFLLVVRRGDD